MGLTRLLNNLTGKSISKRIVKKLNNSEEAKITYKGGELTKGPYGIVLELPSGHKKYYGNDRTRYIVEFFPKPKF